VVAKGDITTIQLKDFLNFWNILSYPTIAHLPLILSIPDADLLLWNNVKDMASFYPTSPNPWTAV
jgi:hypothetical protein